MNYIRELNAFYDWLETNGLSLSAFALWHVLMHIANKAGWTEEFAVAVSVLCAKTGLSPRAVYEARNELKTKGRLEWRSRRGNQSAVYKIVPLSASGADNHADKYLSAINAGNHADNRADNGADNRADNGAPLNKLNKTETKLNSTCSKEQDAVACSDIPTSNKPLIIELTTEYRSIPGITHEQSDYAFIGSCYNTHGYNAVLEAIHILKTRMEAGFTPDKPKIYLMGILKKGEETDGRTDIRGSGRSPRKTTNKGKYDWFYES